jgi:MFS family permease
LANQETSPLTETGKSKIFYGYIIVAVAFLISLVTGGTHYSFGVFFKPLAGEFGWTRAITSGAFSLYVVLSGFLWMITGKLNDRFGPRIVVTGTLFFLGLGYLLMSRIGVIWHLYLFYGVIIAVGMSAAFVPLVSTVARWFVKNRGLMTGIAVSGVSTGTMVMPPLASWLIASFGWRISYIILAVVVWVVLMSIAQLLRRDPYQVGKLPYGYREIQIESPSLGEEGFSTKEAIFTRQFWLLCIITLLFGVFLQGIMVHIVLHAIDVGIPPTMAATILTAIGGLGIAGRIIMGSAGDRIGSRAVLIICYAIITVDLFWLLVVKELWMFYIFAAVFGFAYGGSGVIISPLVADLFGLRSHGVILGIAGFATQIGGAVGPVLAGAMFDTSGSYYMAFLIFIACGFVNVILSLFLTTVGGERKNELPRSA